MKTLRRYQREPSTFLKAIDSCEVLSADLLLLTIVRRFQTGALPSPAPCQYTVTQPLIATAQRPHYSQAPIV